MIPTWFLISSPLCVIKVCLRLWLEIISFCDWILIGSRIKCLPFVYIVFNVVCLSCNWIRQDFISLSLHVRKHEMGYSDLIFVGNKGQKRPIFNFKIPLTFRRNQNLDVASIVGLRSKIGCRRFFRSQANYRGNTLIFRVPSSTSIIQFTIANILSKKYTFIIQKTSLIVAKTITMVLYKNEP